MNQSLTKSQMLILGLQHMVAMFGATILVPIITGLSVSTTLLFAGIGTLLFHLISKHKVPAFLGSSFAFLAGYAAIAPDGIKLRLPYACFGVAVSGLVYLILALIIKLVGIQRVMHYLPPVVTGPIIICIGLSLAPSAIANASSCWPLALIALGTVVIFNVYGKGMFKIIPILMGVVVAYIFAIIFNSMGMTNVDGSQILYFMPIKTAGWFGNPIDWDNSVFAFLKYGVVWDLLIASVITIVPISLATMMEHIGDISAISATTGENFIEDPGLHRTLIGDGIATTLASIFGAPANTTYGENTGVLELSKVYDPRVVRIAAVYAIILSFIPKVSALIGTMPTAIIGGISFILYGMISAVGVRNIVENHVDFTKSRNLIIAAVILVCGLGFSEGVTFTVGKFTIQLTALAIASIVGIVLNAILPGNDYVFGKNLEGDKNRSFSLS